MPVDLLLAPARLTGEWLSTSDPRTWPGAPPADGRPAMLVPGFLAGDPSLRRLGSWLNRGGWTTTRSGLVWNVDCMGRATRALEHRVEALVERTGHKAVVIGQSRGGVFGRVVAARRPDLVDTLITLGSPVRDETDVHPPAWAAIGAIGLLGTLGVPNLFTFDCLRGLCCSEARRQLHGPLAPSVRFVSMYSRRDEIVRWVACQPPDATAIEVGTTHLGMGLDRRVWQQLAAAA